MPGALALVQRPVVTGRHAHHLAEQPREVIGIGVAELLGDLPHLQRALVEQAAGMGHLHLDEILDRRLAGQGAIGLGEMEARQLELRRQLVEVEAVVQVRAHQRLHRVDVQHPSGFQAGPRRTHRQRGEQALQQVRGMDEVRQAEALATQRQQRIELRQQARLHAQAQARGAAQRTQEILRQSAFEMYPVDAPGPLRVGAVGMFPALGQDQQVAAADLDALAGTLQPAASGPAVDQQVVVRRAPLHVVAMRLRIVTEGQRVAGLAERMAGQGATQAGRRDETHPLVGQGPGGGLYGTLHGDATR